jgi:hypothetical protein
MQAELAAVLGNILKEERALSDILGVNSESCRGAG